MNAPATAAAIPRRSFAQTIESLRRGLLADELDKALKQLVLECTAAEKGGEITLKLKLKPQKNGSIDVFDDWSVKAPKADKGSSIMFPTVEGHLQRTDPSQGDLPGIRSVDDEPARPVRSATAA